MKRILILIFSVFLSYSQQVQLSGNVQYTESFGDEVDHNDNTQGDNPFNRLRAKVFIFSPISEKIDLDIEVAFDDQAEPDRWIWLHGANVTFRDVMEDGGLNVRAGKIQMNIGQFVNRINEAENPLI
ncbi:MAG: hypothetical protein KDD94_09690, partial [Calditrichaeota bacterium]|nr:hypothetical protein [Calditrichota bacterium]